MTKTKFSDVLFQKSKLHSLVSRGLFNLNAHSGREFVTSEVQIPIYPARGVGRRGRGADIDRCIIANKNIDFSRLIAKTTMTL